MPCGARAPCRSGRWWLDEDEVCACGPHTRRAETRSAGGDHGMRHVLDKIRPADAQNNACPIRDVLDRIGDQWSLLVLATLDPSDCSAEVVRREVWSTREVSLSNGRCPHCQAAIPGRWEIS